MIMTITAMSGTPMIAAASSSSSSNTATTGAYYYWQYHTNLDAFDVWLYDDALLTGDSKEYNPSLASMTYELAIASMSSVRSDYPQKSRNLKAYLEDNGFIDFETNQDYKKKMETDTMGAACAHKKIVDNGKTYTVLAIVPRSAGYEREWGGNFRVGRNGNHNGFRIGCEKVLEFTKKYVSSHKISGNIKVWTAGYSRGAGVDNQVAAALIDDPKTAIGVDLKPGNLYCYTFGTPYTASLEKDPTADKYAYIHNVMEGYDVVPNLPPAGFGLDKFGVKSGFDNGDRDGMLANLKQIDKVLYDSMTSTDSSSDPYGYKPLNYKFSFEPLTRKVDMQAVDDTEHTYLPTKQADYLDLLAQTFSYIATKSPDNRPDVSGSRDGYVNFYQEALIHLLSFYFGDEKKSAGLAGGIKESPTAIPLVISMFTMFMTESAADKTDTDIDALLDTTINVLALMFENEDGEIKEEYRDYAEAFNLYKSIRDEYFERAEGEETIEIDGKPIDKKYTLKTEYRNKIKNSNFVKKIKDLTAKLYANTMKDGLVNGCGEDPDSELVSTMTSDAGSHAVSHFVAYLLLYNASSDYSFDFEAEISEGVMKVSFQNSQFRQLATLIGNAGRFLTPHNNEVILSWIRLEDPNYAAYKNANTAQQAGYRRLYINQPKGVTVTGTVKDASGKTVATFNNGKITSRTDKWIGITTCDTGNWLRLPADKKYIVELKTNKDAALKLKAAEYDIYKGKIVRTVTKDKKFNWQKLSVKKTDKVKWVISKVATSKYKMPSSAYYYIEKKSVPGKVIVAKGTAKGKKAIKITWNKVSGASRYVLYMSICNDGKKEYTPKKIKTFKAGTQTWTKKSLKKGVAYKFYVTAEKKVNGKYKAFLKSAQGHVVTGNQNKIYTNPKSIKLNKSKVTLRKGKTFKIKGKVTKIKSGKKLMTTHVSSLLRFVSDNNKVAKVSKSGKVTAVTAGKCKIYAQAPSGMWKTVTVTVK